jgi:hypothetical protein
MSVDPALNASNRARAVLALVVAFAFAFACAACSGEPTPKYLAVGTLVHDALADDDRAGWAKEIEIAKSLGAKEGHAVSVKRRTGSRLIEVSVRDDDGKKAQEVCNRVLRAYVDDQVRGAQGPQEDERKRLQARLEELEAILRKGPTEPPEVVKEFQTTLRRLQEIGMSDTGHRINVQIVDPCHVARPGERT